MKKILKILFVCLSVGFIAGISFILRLETQPPISAQTDYIPSYSLICDEPIPIGETIEETKDFMNEIYKAYQDAHDMLNLVLPSLTTEIVELTKQKQEVCDFSKCKPMAKDKGLNVEVNIRGIGEQNVVDAHTPVCYADECSGEPCPELEEYLTEATDAPAPIKAGAVGFSTIDDVIYDLFNNTIECPYELKQKEKSEGPEPITKFEAIERKIQLAREWLHPGYEGSCALTDRERAMVEAGEMGTRFPAKCVEALEQGLYWPKMSPKICEPLCASESGYGCEECFLQYDDNSVLTKINHKIYVTCGGVCKNELTKECVDCLCDGKSEKECVAWLCGGSYYNWVCCHETPLEAGTAAGGICPSVLSTLCPTPETLARCNNAPYPAKRATQLDALLNCIAEQTEKPMPNEGEGNEFYGSVFTYEHNNPLCNYTRGMPVCGECEHSEYSCHYAGKNGSQGALAVDFGNENNYRTIKDAAIFCGIPVQRILLETGGATHIHISHPDCDVSL